MHLVGYLYEDDHDARSLEHKVIKYVPAIRAEFFKKLLVPSQFLKKNPYVHFYSLE
jgi:hypothetical protein